MRILCVMLAICRASLTSSRSMTAGVKRGGRILNRDPQLQTCPVRGTRRGPPEGDRKSVV